MTTIRIALALLPLLPCIANAQEQAAWFIRGSTIDGVADLEKKELAIGIDRAMSVLWHSNMLFVGISDVPPKLIKFPNALDLSSYLEITLPNDGLHVAARQMFYSRTRGKILVLFQGSSSLTIMEVDPITLEAHDAIHNNTDVNDMFSMTTDETNLWVAGFGQGGYEGYDISQFRLSDWGFVGQLMYVSGIPKLGSVSQQWSPIKYDKDTGRIYGINGSNGLAWGFSAPASNMSNFTARVTPVPFDGVGHNIEIVGDYIYAPGLTELSPVPSHRLWRMNKATLAIERLDAGEVPAGNTNCIQGLHFDGRYLWISSQTNGTARSTIQRFDSVTLRMDTAILPETNGIFEITGDGTNLFAVGRSLPGSVYRLKFPEPPREPPPTKDIQDVFATVTLSVGTNSAIIGYTFAPGVTNQVWQTRVVTNYTVSFAHPYGDPNAYAYGIKYREDLGPVLTTYTIPGPILNPCQ